MTDTLHLTTAPPGGNDVWPIHSATAMERSVHICRLSGQMGLITGPSGIGKTTALRAVIASLEYDGFEAQRVMMTRAANGLQPGLLRICRAIGASVQPNMGGADIYDALVAHIATTWPRGSVLALDEAQFMSDELLDALRNVADEMRERNRVIGIVMVGTTDLAARINGKIGGRAKHFEPLRGRLYVEDLAGLAAEDFGAIAARLGLAGPKAAELLARIGTGAGGLHNMARVIQSARRLAGPDNPLSLPFLRVAIQGLGVAA